MEYLLDRVGDTAGLGGAVAAGLAGLGAMAPGLVNPCLGALPPELASHDLVLSAWDGLDAQQVWDVHVHLLGTGDAGSGASIHPYMSQWWHPLEFGRRLAILNSACVPHDVGSIDRAYVEQLHREVHDFPAGAGLCHAAR